MGAVVAVLNESLTESIKGFYKLRRAFITLNAILDAETKYMRRKTGTGLSIPTNTSTESFRSERFARSLKGLPGGFDEDEDGAQDSRPPSIRSAKGSRANNVAEAKAVYQRDKNRDDEDNEDDEFYEADETHDKSEKTERYAGHLDTNDVAGGVEDLSLNEAAQSKDLPSPKQLPPTEGMLDHDPDSDVFSNPIDVFIHSGANLCFGLLLVMISMIPPAFGKLLFIIGFRGDRDRGLRMLWQASKFHNINGAMAGLCLLGYYHAVVGFADIIPDSTMNSGVGEPVEGYPKERCAVLLADMRRRHPGSHLWLLEEARMQATNHHLSTAISLLSNTKPSPLKQVEALDMFEKSLNAMYIHDYDLCATSFVACVSLNNWSHALYYYIAGAAQLELYRGHKTTNSSVAATHAKKATEYFRTTPQHAGKKKFMARQLPFDIFVTRKIKKWEARALEYKIPFIDAIGVSPLEEMIFFWSGYKRMDTSQLEDSLTALAWSEDRTSNQVWSREGPDERAILAILRAAVLRNLHRWEEAKSALRTGVLSVDRVELKGGLKDDWTAPVAHYEMGAINWMQRVQIAQDGKGSLEEQEKYVRECEAWIDKAAKWESYELDARVGLKVATAQDTLAKWKKWRNAG